VIDACRPFEMLKDFPPVACASPELKQRVAEKFKSYLVGL
jgi:4-hydroxy-3-polyprenylbenzoate decarboxylase